MKIIKRNGDSVEFDKSKISNAVLKAMEEVDGEIYETDTANDIANDIEKEYSIYQSAHPEVVYDVEHVQDCVEDYLMRSERKDVAKAYIRYRYKKEIVRNNKSDFMRAISEKLNGANIENQNANVDEHSFGGRTGEATSVMTKKYALDYIVSDMARKNHLNNRIYIHDLDAYAVGSHNCLSIPFDKLLAKGFNTRQADIRPANSVGTAMQLVAVIFQLQSLQQFGGVSATHLDWTMVPYVRKSFFKHWQDGIKYIGQIYIPDDVDVEQGNSEKAIDSYPKDHTHSAIYKYAYEMTEKELNQSVEAMYHNLNTLQSRSGNQLPFTSINYGTCTLPEGRMVTRALLNGSIKGVGKLHKTSIFPCGIFQCMKGVNRDPGDPNYDLYRLALESTARRLYPNYANIDWSVNEGYDRNDPCTYVATIN